MRVVFLLLLFQFVAPAFLPVTSQDIDNTDQKRSATIHTQHTSIAILILLKEKEENENEELNDRSHEFTLLPLIDFTDHTLVLTALHAFKHNFIPIGQRYDHEPPLFTIFCTYII